MKFRSENSDNANMDLSKIGSVNEPISKRKEIESFLGGWISNPNIIDKAMEMFESVLKEEVEKAIDEAYVQGVQDHIQGYLANGDSIKKLYKQFKLH